MQLRVYKSTHVVTVNGTEANDGVYLNSIRRAEEVNRRAVRHSKRFSKRQRKIVQHRNFET